MDLQDALEGQQKQVAKKKYVSPLTEAYPQLTIIDSNATITDIK